MCIFCLINKNVVPCNLIYEDDYVKAILDVAPATKGHIIIITKKHFENIFEMDEDCSNNVFSAVVKVSKHLNKILDLDGLNIVQNNNEYAGQTMFHFHIHLIPRYKNDKVKISWERNHFNLSEIEEFLKIK